MEYQEPSTVARQSQIKYGCKNSLNLAISGFSKTLPILIVSEWRNNQGRGRMGRGDIWKQPLQMCLQLPRTKCYETA